LIDRVTDLYVSIVERHRLPNGAPMVARIASMRGRSHTLRRTRNILVHAAYIEMKAGHHGRERTTAEFRASADIAAARPAIATTRPPPPPLRPPERGVETLSAASRDGSIVAQSSRN